MTLAHEPLVALPVVPLSGVREVRHLTVVPPAPLYEQGMLPLAYSLRNGVDAVPSGPDDEQVEASSRAIPNPRAWAGRLVQAVIEVTSHDRPVTQLARWTAPDVYAQLTSLHRAAAAEPRGVGARPPRQAVVSVRVCQVACDAVEVAARVMVGRRSRAVAARLDFQRGRWTCTALTLG